MDNGPKFTVLCLKSQCEIFYSIYRNKEFIFLRNEVMKYNEYRV